MSEYNFYLEKVDTMAITWAIEIADLVPSETSRELSKLKNIIEKDNVKNLAKTQKGKFDTYAEKQNKTNKESPDNQNSDKDFVNDNALDKRIEEEFDKYLFALWIKDISGTTNKIITGNMSALQNDFNAYLQKEFADNSEFSQYMNLLKNAEIKDALQAFSFELEALSQEVIASLESSQSITGGWNAAKGEAGNVLVGDKPTWETKNAQGDKIESTKESENKNIQGHEFKDDYLEPYPSTSYTTLTREQDIENIYRDNKLAKVMESVFDDEESKELRRWTFRVNLGKENGLAAIIIAIREAVANKDNTDGNNVHKKLYDRLDKEWILHHNGEEIDLEFSRKDLKELIKDGSLRYKHEWWLDNEINKVAKILSRAQRKDLNAFASLIQSKSDITMVVKKRNNAKEMTGNDVEHRGESSLITSDNVLIFLCDTNSDAQIDATYKRKDNKEQRNQWDVGTLFGQQILFTLEQAIAVKNVELGDPQGEYLVIQNIIKNMKISDSRSLENIHLITMKNDINKCSKENLAKLVNGSPSEGIVAMPEMKIFFLDAIKKINGGSKAVQPDLYNTLVGRETESLMALYESQEAERQFKNKLDEILTTSEEPGIKEAIRRQGLVRVRETLFTSIMKAIDNVEITTNDGTQTNIMAAGVSKWREINALKKEILESTIKSLILSWIHYNSEWWLILTLGYGREWQSETYRTKRNRGVQWGVILTWGKVEIIVGLNAGIAEQYNYKKVINADLSQVKRAKYLGIEWWALAGIKTQNLTKVELEAYAGINWQQDPEAGINQIDKQYRAVSEEIFNSENASSSILSDETKFTKYITDRIATLKTDSTYGRFVETNEQHLTDDLTFMVRYMKENNFFGTDGLFSKISKTKDVNVVDMAKTLLGILQSGNIEQRRHDLIAGLHGSIKLTKLSFGVTTNALTLSSWKSWAASWETPPAPGHTGVDGSPTGTAQEKGQDRFWLYGLYIWARISTWRNMYVPNVAQYLFTQYEVGQGLGVESVDFTEKDLDIYGRYLVALYHDEPKNRLSYNVTNGTLVLNFDPQWSDLTLAKFLNIHATAQAQSKFSLRGNEIIIGNVGDMATYTVTEGTGVRRILCLGTKKLDEATRITGNIWAIDIEPVIFEATAKPRNKEKITTDIISHMESDWDNSKVENVRKEMATFFDAEGKLQTPPNCIVTFEPTTIEHNTLKNGTLTIQKTANNTFTVSLDTSTSADQLKIRYLDQTTYMEDINNPDNREKEREIVSLSEIQTIFTMPANVTDAFADSTERTLSIFDDYQNTLYKNFMKYIVDDWLDHFINADNYDKAFTTLKSILENNNEYKNLPNLISLMESNLSYDEKIFIVDKFKTIFSYITYLSNGKKDGQNLSALIINKRKNAYTRILWPDESTKYPCSTDYRTTILENLKGRDELTRTPVENLIGFTAFYRLGGEARKYAMTPIGWTKVLTWATLESSMMHLDATDEKNTKEWFISNLEVNTDHKTMVLEKFNLLLKNKGITITSDQLPALLKWESLSIDSWRKISIDISRVFYLLGECANESLGMKIEGIKIQEFKQTNEYVAIWTPEQEYRGGLHLSVKNDSITSVVLTQEEKVSWRHRQSLAGLTTPPPPNPTDVDPELPPPPPNPTDVDPNNP